MSLSNFTAPTRPEIPPNETPIIVIVSATFIGFLFGCVLVYYCCQCMYPVRNPQQSIVVRNPVVAV